MPLLYGTFYRKASYTQSSTMAAATHQLLELCMNHHFSPIPGKDYIGVSVGAMILNDQGEVFLSQRSQQSRNERGCWENPGGRVEFGETLENAVKREIKEEFGVDIIIQSQFPAADHLIPEEGQHWVATTFITTLAPGHEPQIMEPAKCDAIGWFKLDHLPKPLSLITQMDLSTYLKSKAA